MTAQPADSMTEQTGDSWMASTNTPECPWLQFFKQIYKEKMRANLRTSFTAQTF